MPARSIYGGRKNTVKVLMLTGGSRGDVQPFIALGYALINAGHQVLIGGPVTSASVAESYGVPYELIYDVTLDAYRGRLAGLAVKLSGNGNPLFLLQQLTAHRRNFHKTLEDISSLSYQDCDIVLHNHMAPGHHIAEKIGVPSVPVAVSLMFGPTSEFFNPWLGLSRFPIPKILNRPSYRATKLLCSYNFGNTEKWRNENLGLPKRAGNKNFLRLPNGNHNKILQPNSTHFLPPATTYPEWVHTTGFWYLPTPPGWTPPSQLAEFIEAGEPPVYIGFGSLSRAENDPGRRARISEEAARRAGVRAIVFPGDPDRAPNSSDGRVFHLSTAVPFGWLFPKMAAVVHHAGTGTMGEALASGRPQVVCPAVCDQPFNAERAYALGISTKPLPLYRISAQSLSNAIHQAIKDISMRQRAKDLETLIRNQDGTKRAVDIIHSLV